MMDRRRAPLLPGTSRSPVSDAGRLLIHQQVDPFALTDSDRAVADPLVGRSLLHVLVSDIVRRTSDEIGVLDADRIGKITARYMSRIVQAAFVLRGVPGGPSPSSAQTSSSSSARALSDALTHSLDLCNIVMGSEAAGRYVKDSFMRWVDEQLPRRFHPLAVAGVDAVAIPSATAATEEEEEVVVERWFKGRDEAPSSGGAPPSDGDEDEATAVRSIDDLFGDSKHIAPASAADVSRRLPPVTFPAREEQVSDRSPNTSGSTAASATMMPAAALQHPPIGHVAAAVAVPHHEPIVTTKAAGVASLQHQMVVTPPPPVVVGSKRGFTDAAGAPLEAPAPQQPLHVPYYSAMAAAAPPSFATAAPPQPAIPARLASHYADVKRSLGVVDLSNSSVGVSRVTEFGVSPGDHRRPAEEIHWVTRSNSRAGFWMFPCCGQMAALHEGEYYSVKTCNGALMTHGGSIHLLRPSRTQARAASGIAEWECCKQSLVEPVGAPANYRVQLTQCTHATASRTTAMMRMMGGVDGGGDVGTVGEKRPRQDALPPWYLA